MTPMTARFSSGQCRKCNAAIVAGAAILYDRAAKRAEHQDCDDIAVGAAAALPSDGTIRKGDKVIVARGRKVPRGTVGIVKWIGESGYRNTGPRAGLKIDGEEKLVYTAVANLDLASAPVANVPPAAPPAPPAPPAAPVRKPDPARVGVKYIVIERAEGPSALCGKPVAVRSFEEASATLAGWATTAPATGGYDKCDFVVVWDDGETYEGRADLQREHTAGYDLREHIRSFWSWIVANKAESAESARAALAKYDVADSAPVASVATPPAKDAATVEHLRFALGNARAAAAAAAVAALEKMIADVEAADARYAEVPTAVAPARAPIVAVHYPAAPSGLVQRCVYCEKVLANYVTERNKGWNLDVAVIEEADGTLRTVRASDETWPLCSKPAPAAAPKPDEEMAF